MLGTDDANGGLTRSVRLIEKSHRRAAECMLVAEERICIRRPESSGLPLAVQVWAVVPHAAADAELVPAWSPTARNDARMRARSHAGESSDEVANAPGQPPCSSMTSSILPIRRIVSEIATTIFW